MAEFHKRIMVGVEIEAYSISAADYQIGRRRARPRPGLSESGERFTHDDSIGSEYISRPFSTIREAAFLLKTGLRKYLRNLYGGEDGRDRYLVPLLVGGWTNRSAGTHVHVALAKEPLSAEDASSLAYHLHDHIPLFVAACANSPIWDKRLTAKASNRFLRGEQSWFTPVERGPLTSESTCEMLHNPGRKRKPPTVELRVMDSNIPEYVVAVVSMVKAVALHWLRREAAVNKISHADYLTARHEAGSKGMRCRLCWNGEWMPARDYLDRFLWELRDEYDAMDVPDDIFEVLKLLKRGYTGSRIIHDAALHARNEHPQTWQRRFAKRYSKGLEHLLSGNTLRAFAAELEVELPNTDNVWLGRKGALLGA